MSSQSRAIITWVLAVLFTALSVAHEALHCLPGCGHGLLVAGQLVYIGVLQPDGAFVSSGYEPAIRRPMGESPPILSDGQCAICSHFLQGQSPTTAVHFVVELPYAQELPPSGTPCCHLPPLLAFHSRAPPPV
ncbi:MAG: hypothetical protein ACLQNE_41915 [Thermoguttaceae bacterium]